MLPSTFAGQPPSKDLMTFQVDDLVGAHVGVHDRSTEHGDHEKFGEHREDEETFDGSTVKFKVGYPIRTSRKGSGSKGLDVGSRESRTDQGFLRQKSQWVRRRRNE